MTHLEWRRILNHSGLSDGVLTKAMQSAMADAVHGEERGDCPLLKDGKCSVYEVRPAICRVFGSSLHERLVCPHGRKPEQPMNPDGTDAMMDRIKDLGLGIRMKHLTA